MFEGDNAMRIFQEEIFGPVVSVTKFDDEVRVTYDGEFLHDAYWNRQLGQANLSHGCTNMAPADAQWYYTWSQIGDPVTWTNTGTAQVLPVWDGYGDWNLAWAAYQHGGLLSPAT